MKKVVLFSAVVAILFLHITAYALDDKYKNIKVGLSYGDNAPSSATVECEFGFSVGCVANDVFSEIESTTCNFITITSAESGFVNLLYSDGTSKILPTDGSQILTIYPNNGNLKINNTAYRGAAMFLNNNASSLTVINYLGLEEYLYGVIGSEMPSSWNTEALKAQAVCARSFAITNFSKHASYGFNVCKTTNCQVYGGISSETTSVTKAVDETENQVLMYDGNVAQTLFFSTSGGYTADVKNVWGTAVPYLCGVEDPYENPTEASKHSWTATLSNADIKNALANLGVNIGDIVNVTAKIDNTTHVYQLDIEGTNGSHTLKNQSVCSAFSSFGVQSQKYIVTPYGGNGLELFGISSSQKTKLSEFNTVSGNGIISQNTPKFAISSNGVFEYSDYANEGYVFNGGGWGHGVGMSQYGAKGMADNGYTYDKILYHYYPGTYLE